MRIAHDVKGFLKDSVNKLTVITLIFGITITAGLIKIHQEIKETQQAITKCEKKVDYRYFNLTRSLEDIHGIKIDTHKGRIEN